MGLGVEYFVGCLELGAFAQKFLCAVSCLLCLCPVSLWVGLSMYAVYMGNGFFRQKIIVSGCVFGVFGGGKRLLSRQKCLFPVGVFSLLVVWGWLFCVWWLRREKYLFQECSGGGRRAARGVQSRCVHPWASCWVWVRVRMCLRLWGCLGSILGLGVSRVFAQKNTRPTLRWAGTLGLLFTRHHPLLPRNVRLLLPLLPRQGLPTRNGSPPTPS